jgi:ketosteroid isomerase-like protein
VAGSASAAGSAAGRAAAAPGVLAFDTDPDAQEAGMVAAFGKQIPRLPAISADGSSIASFDSDATGPSIPLPMTLAIRNVGADKVVQSLPIVDDQMVIDAGNSGGSNWPPAAVAQTLHTRAQAVLARLRGFRSLTSIELATDADGEPRSAELGDLAMTIDPGDSTLVVALHDAHGRTLQREKIDAYQSGTREVGLDKPIACDYRPRLAGLYRDPNQPAHLYAWIGYRSNEECAASQQRFLLFSGAAGDTPESVVFEQFELAGLNTLEPDSVLVPGAAMISTDLVTTDLKRFGVAERAMDYRGHDDKNVQVTLSRDGKSAWASELARITLLEKTTAGREMAWRASDVLTRTPAGWRIAALAWTQPVANAQANARAKAGKLAVQKLDGDPGDAGLRDAFAKLTTDGVDAAATARADLVAIGSGPGERTVGGGGFARAWRAGWKGKITIASAQARVLPSGTTGWVAATIELAKPGYKIPFTVFAIFDKTAAGAWSLVHIHLAVAPG